MSSTTVSLDEQSRFYRIKMIRSRAKNGLLLLTLRNAVMRLGIDIDPYWICREGLDLCPDPPGIKDDSRLYEMRKIDDTIIREQYTLMGWSTSDLNQTLALDHLSYGLYREDELTAFMIARINQYVFKDKTFKLKPHEAYLGGMYTFEKFRGRSLAPFLRFKCYEILSKDGYTTFYSITQYFNRSSARFKEKLNGSNQGLFLYLGLFRKLNFTLTLRKK